MEEHVIKMKANIIDWIRFDTNSRIMIIGDETDALNLYLSNKGYSVDEVKAFDSIDDISEYSVYDYIFLYDFYHLCNVSQKYPQELLDDIVSNKKDTCALYLLMENKLGIKYWAGCPDEQTGVLFKGIEDYSSFDNQYGEALSKKELESILNNLALSNRYKFYYPYPDYKLPTIIFTDEYLPSVDSLNRNNLNVNGDRFVLFNEQKAFNTVIKAELFPDFSNSFMIQIV